MRKLMADSRLNRAERHLQHSFRKSLFFNAFILFSTILSAYWAIRPLPDIRPRPVVSVPLSFEPVQIASPKSPLRLAGAWVVTAGDGRLGGVSALAIDRGRLLAVSDRGAVIRLDYPSAAHPMAQLADLRHGPGTFGEKWVRDAESIAPDPGRRGWWVGYEQKHSLWHYDAGFGRVISRIDLDRDDWRDNRGAEGLLSEGNRLLVTAENGRDLLLVNSGGIEMLPFDAGAEVADAARAPDGNPWLLLREKGLGGVSQAIAPLIRIGQGYRAGPALPVPKGMFDNYEGMAIEARPNGDWRFWLITDDGHRFFARTLLVALDYSAAGQDKGPATVAEPS